MKYPHRISCIQKGGAKVVTYHISSAWSTSHLSSPQATFSVCWQHLPHPPLHALVGWTVSSQNSCLPIIALHNPLFFFWDILCCVQSILHKAVVPILFPTPSSMLSANKCSFCYLVISGVSEQLVAQLLKNPPAKAGDLGSILGLGRSPGEGNGNPLQYSGLENPVDWGAWRATVHGVAKSRTQLSAWYFHSHTTSREDHIPLSSPPGHPSKGPKWPSPNWLLIVSSHEVRNTAHGASSFPLQK